jgi:hypothetical protein
LKILQNKEKKKCMLIKKKIVSFLFCHFFVFFIIFI